MWGRESKSQTHQPLACSLAGAFFVVAPPSIAAAAVRVDLETDHQGHREEPPEQRLVGGPGQGHARADAAEDKVCACALVAFGLTWRGVA